MNRASSMLMESKDGSEAPASGMKNQPQAFTQLEPVQEAQLRARLGRGYGRIGPRKALRRLTGLKGTATHNRTTGLAEAADPRLNAFYPVAEVAAVIVAARCQLDTPQLIGSLVQRMNVEQVADGTEDVTQGDVRAALVVLAGKRGAFSDSDRRKAQRTLVAHRDALLEYLPDLLAVLGDLEALIARGPAEETVN